MVSALKSFRRTFYSKYENGEGDWRKDMPDWERGRGKEGDTSGAGRV